MNNPLSDSVVLITGGTGSFGLRIANALLLKGVREIRIFSRDEKKQWEMQQLFSDFTYLIGDVRDIQRLYQVMEGVDYVFHAAALKHVPVCETFPMEALKTNIMGTQNACEAARANKVKAFVALSTDKAVKPINAMGISKAMMEKIVCQQNRVAGPTIFSCVRYGNVLGSRGSVVPLFLRQIRDNHPLTVTIPEMTRFLLTLDESVDLVLYALTKAKGGEIFVRKAPACTVKHLAEAVRLKYSPLKERHPIEIIGIRVGEKIHEVLVNEYEMQRAYIDETYFTIHPEYRHIDISNVKLGDEYTSANTRLITNYEETMGILDRMGKFESFI